MSLSVDTSQSRRRLWDGQQKVSSFTATYTATRHAAACRSLKVSCWEDLPSRSGCSCYFCCCWSSLVSGRPGDAQTSAGPVPSADSDEAGHRFRTKAAIAQVKRRHFLALCATLFMAGCSNSDPAPAIAGPNDDADRLTAGWNAIGDVPLFGGCPALC